MLGRMTNAPRLGLTPMQQRAIDFIIGFIEKNAFSPSYDEICLAMYLASKSGVHRLVISLQERGCVRINPNKARSIYPTEQYLESRRNSEIDRMIRRMGSETALKLLRRGG